MTTTARNARQMIAIERRIERMSGKIVALQMRIDKLKDDRAWEVKRLCDLQRNGTR